MDQLLENLKNYLSSQGLAVESGATEGNISSLPSLRKVIQMFKAKEVRDMVQNKYSNVDLLAGGTFSGMPVIGIFTLADNLNPEDLQKIHEQDYLQTKNIWNEIQDKNFFQNWKDWALYYSNVVAALSGICCLRYFIFTNPENFKKNKDLIRKMKKRDISPQIGVYGFACDTTNGDVSAPSWTLWWGAGAFGPGKLKEFFKK